MRDLVDNQLLDVQGKRLTKVGGVEAECREGTRPIVRALLVGPEPLARRLGPWIARMVERLRGTGKEIRIPWKHVQEVGADVRLRVPGHYTGANRLEEWVSNKIIAKLPGLR